MEVAWGLLGEGIYTHKRGCVDIDIDIEGDRVAEPSLDGLFKHPLWQFFLLLWRGARARYRASKELVPAFGRCLVGRLPHLPIFSPRSPQFDDLVLKSAGNLVRRAAFAGSSLLSCF